MSMAARAPVVEIARAPQAGALSYLYRSDMIRKFVESCFAPCASTTRSNGHASNRSMQARARLRSR